MAGRKDPFRNFRFQVKIGTTVTKFSEVSVPETTVANIEYRDGDDPTYKRQLSGLTSFGNLTLKRGIVEDMSLHDWFQNVVSAGAGDYDDKDKRKNITITLLDEGGKPKSHWSITNAWPIKYEGGDLNATGNEVFIESMELVHEGIERAKN